MNTVDRSDRWARLIKRRTEITMTLRHVELEQKDIEAKAASMDQDARASRLTLLRDLSDWYSREFHQVDQALRRVDQNNFSLCIACGAPISTESSAGFPEADLCADCQNLPKQL